ncbi:hypothetical protein IF2G_09240 [Cordyceps javanica]|nr:hypothetical protein IF2G_09240 [Cordyceps javanica]
MRQVVAQNKVPFCAMCLCVAMPLIDTNSVLVVGIASPPFHSIAWLSLAMSDNKCGETHQIHRTQ